MLSLYQRTKSQLNPWFLYPFFGWLAVGAVLLERYSRDTLFGSVNQRHNSFLDVLMQLASIMGEGAGIALLLLSLMSFKSCRNWWYFATATVCVSIPALLTQALKNYYNAPRPFEYYKADPTWIHFEAAWGDHLYHNSFPSGHTTGIFSLCVFLSLILPKKWKFLGILFFFFALLVAYSRLYLAAHFFADIYAGSIIGTSTALLCFTLMQHLLKRNIQILPHRHTQPFD